MKQSPSERRILENMAAGVLSRDGFLGSDGRPVAEILDADNAAVTELGVTHEDIARRLEQILRTATDALGRPVSVGPGQTAVYREAMGRIPCPWGGCGVVPKGEVELTDERDRHVLRFTPLSVHLIRAHGFYQGRGSRYRLSPRDLVQRLDMRGGDK